MIQHFSIGLVRREQAPSAKGKDGCFGVIIEPDGWASEVKSNGIEWVVEKRHPPKSAERREVGAAC